MSQYVPAACTFATAPVVAAAMVTLTRLPGPRPRVAPPTKGAAFECGNAPTGTAWSRWSIKFYMVAILFIVFDVEVVFMYPWAVIFRELGWYGFVEMMIFVAVLGVGFLFAWRKGAFEWN